MSVKSGNLSPDRPTIAAVAIAKNEEVDIKGFLENLQSWVDEIVIVDDGSTDSTVAIIRSAGDRVKLVERKMDDESGFSGQRNAGIDVSESDWLIHMDIDERVTPELATEIRQKIINPELNALRYRRLNFFLHHPMRGGGWQHWNNPQIARRGHHHFKNRIHEECMVDGGDERTGQLESMMWHLNDEDYVERVSKNLRYMQKSGQEIIDKGIRVRWYHLLFYPLYRAFRSFFYDAGYREGVRGLLFSLYSFTSSFNWWAYAWERQNRIERYDLENQIKEKWENYNEKK